jgi:hypothetical protein
MFKSWPKIPRLYNELFTLSEKVDGTNAAVVISNEGADDSTIFSTEVDGKVVNVWAQSRTRLITPDNDNYGFARWVKENAETLVKELGFGYHYGEWWGKGINRGYGVDKKYFSLFNPTKQTSITKNIPLLATDVSISMLETVIDDSINNLVTNGSKIAPGYTRPEGIVVYSQLTSKYYKVIIDK